jgi:hypothetical protein
MSDAWFGIMGVLVGGLITLAGTLYADLRRDRWERIRLEKDRIRTAAFAVQDALDELFEQYRRALDVKWPNRIGSTAIDAEHARAIRRINIATIRVGDQPLADRTGELLAALGKAVRSDDVDEATRYFNEALDSWSPLNQRMGKLLYEAGQIETGVAQEEY